jgi:tRNA nucleotidyltransferase/poly(A) polymerase
VLRAIRFASRFNFSLDAELVQAASSAQIRAALDEKVSRERVYKECEGCMSKENSRPFLAFTLMHRY